MQNTLEQVLKQLNESPETIEFSQIMAIVDENYHYTPSQFTNGKGDTIATNDSGTNEGSCKIFAFAHLNQLSETQTLQCFGNYYRDDVLQHPEASDHANIRNFIQHGWSGINFSAFPLKEK